MGNVQVKNFRINILYGEDQVLFDVYQDDEFFNIDLYKKRYWIKQDTFTKN